MPSQSERPQDRLALRLSSGWTIAIAAGLFAIWSALFIYRSSFVGLDGNRYFSLFDDAMVSMRYAWNLAHGHGLVWNPGERVEGYTNLLMVLAMLLPNLTLPKHLASLPIQALGGLLVLTSAFLARKIAAEVDDAHAPRKRSLLGPLTFLATLAYYPLAYWSLMGMETGLVTALLLTAVLSCLRYSRTKNSAWAALASSALGLAFLARPDSLIFAAALTIYLARELAARAALSRRALFPLLLPLAPVVLLPLGQFLFRAAYYHATLPNTYALKLTGMPLGIRLINGVGFLLPFLASVSLVMLVAIAGLVLRPRGWKVLFLVLAVLPMGYQIWTGGDAWPLWRIPSPSIPLLLIAFLSASADFGDSLARLPRWPAFASSLAALMGVALVYSVLTIDGSLLGAGTPLADAAVVPALGLVLAAVPLTYPVLARVAPENRGTTFQLVSCALALTVMNSRFLPEVLSRIPPYQVDANVRNVQSALAVSEVTSREASVGVFWAGAIPYFSGLYAVDFLGKSDPYIAHLPPDLSGAIGWAGMSSVPGHNKYDLYHSIVELAPTYVQNVEVMPVPNVQWGQQDLTEWVSDHYAAVCYEGVVMNLRRDDPNVLWEKTTDPCP
jgi:hypothetical protein